MKYWIFFQYSLVKKMPDSCSSGSVKFSNNCKSLQVIANRSQSLQTLSDTSIRVP